MIGQTEGSLTKVSPRIATNVFVSRIKHEDIRNLWKNAVSLSTTLFQSIDPDWIVEFGSSNMDLPRRGIVDLTTRRNKSAFSTPPSFFYSNWGIMTF